MESQGLPYFMLFYLREGIQVLANTHDHVLRTTKQDWLDDYDDDVVSSRSCMIDDDEYDLLL